MTVETSKRPTVTDFTWTPVPEQTGGDKVTFRLSRDGEPDLTMTASLEQLVWVIDDADYFAQWYGFAVAQRDQPVEVSV
jgi:hypothetical protein